MQPDGVTAVASQYLPFGSPPSWTFVDPDSPAFGVYNPYNEYSRAANANLPGTADSTQYAFANLTTLGHSATFTYSGASLGNFVAGDTYTLTVAIGDTLGDTSPTYSVSLLSNGSPVGTAGTGTATAGIFTDLSETFTATALQNGQTIGILLTGTDNIGGFEQPNLTNVRLSVVTPEPSSALLLTLAGVGLVFWSRRRRGQR